MPCYYYNLQFNGSLQNTKTQLKKSVVEARHLTPAMPLSDQLYLWIAVNLMLGGNPAMERAGGGGGGGG